MGTSPATRHMRQRLLALPFPAFALVVSQLLRRLGYEGVALRGVTGSKGRNSYGGLDIEATLLKGLTRSRVICQLRQYDTVAVPRQSVDVLRGAMLRVGADHGLLVTTSGFAPSAVEAAQAAQHVAPVRLIEGNELAMLLLRYNLLSEDNAPHPSCAAGTPGTEGAAGAGRKAWPVRAVPTHGESLSAGSPVAEAQRGAQPPAATTATPSLPSPKEGRRCIAITIVLSPLSRKAGTEGQSDAAEKPRS